jgi:orsellinic acid C2-O-methyltransferase
MVTPGAQSEVPPQVALYHLAIGHYVSHALQLVAKLKVADLLSDGPRSAEELAAASGTDAPSLRRVIRLLASAGVFEEQASGAIALTALGQCLRTGVPGSAHAMVMLFAGERIQENWKELEYCVRTGNPAYRQRGIEDPFAEPQRTPDEAAAFDAAMADMTRLTAIAVAAAYDFSRLRTVVDVGGGNGALLTGLLKANPHLRGIVFDQPDATARARTQIADSGLAARCEAIGGDFFKDVPAGGDAYLLKHVIHDWDDARAITILGNCRRAMRTDGTLLIVEGVYPPRIDQSLASRGAAANDVNMLVNTGGRQRSEAEFRSLYDGAGFTLRRLVPTTARVFVIEGVPA